MSSHDSSGLRTREAEAHGPVRIVTNLRGAARRHPRWTWLLIALVVVLVLAWVVSSLLDEPLRRRLESAMNAQLKGYTVRIGRVDFHPLNFALDLEDWTIVQDARPDPPVAYVPKLTASVQWRALLHAAVVADFVFTRPSVHLTRHQAATENRDAVPVTQRGWQDALEEVYPLKINDVRVIDGNVTYDDQGPLEPIRLTHLYVTANDIRNVRSHPGEFPSPFHVEAWVLDSAPIRIDGAADFLAEPQAAVRAIFDVEDLRLDFLKPAAHHWNVEIERGAFAATGEVESTKDRTEVHLQRGIVNRAKLDYVVARAAEGPGTKAAKATARAVGKAEPPAVVVRADRLEVHDSAVGVVNRITTPPWRLFASDLEVMVERFSNVPEEGGGKASVHGRFMGTGPLSIRGVFAPATGGRPAFELDLSVEDTQLTQLNDLLRAYGGFDVAGGTLAVYSELDVKDGRVEGYVKPILHDVDVYDSKQEQGKGILQKTYEAIIGGAAVVFENRRHDQVATQTDLSGPVDNPQSSTLQILLNVLRNAFFSAILPGVRSAQPGP